MASGKKVAGGIIGLDIGGTKTDAVLWNGRRVARAVTIATPKNRKEFLKAIINLIGGMIQGRKLSGIGLAIAGPVDAKRGVILGSGNLPFLVGWDLAGVLRKKFRVPVRIENDVNCFLLAEARFGRARGKRDVVGLTIGTGVGGAVMADGRILRGARGAAAELGHMVIDQGLNVEDLISSHGFRRLGYADPRKATAGAYRRIENYLGVALANIVNIFDPELILLGGGIAAADKFSLAHALRSMKKHLILSRRKAPPVHLSRLRHASALGAAALLQKA